MSESLQPPQEEYVTDVPGMSLGEMAEEIAGGIGLAILKRRLAEGGTIEIPSLGMVLDSTGAGTGHAIDLDDSEYTIK